jgi:lysophospholipase L1-like esterase
VRSRLRLLLATAGGTIAALLFLEGAVRPLATASQPPAPDPASDRLTAPVVTSRQIEAGIAAPSYSIAGARLTGNATLQNAPVVVILGDSHVAAREVRDSETMGSWLERIARANGKPINVRQYGWRGASPPQYLLAASDVIGTWHPAHVVIVLGGDDVGADPLNRNFPRMRIATDGSVDILTGSDAGAARLRKRHDSRGSSLAGLTRARWEKVLQRSPRFVRYHFQGTADDRGPAPSASEVARVPRAEVLALSRAFGPSLTLVYIAAIRATGGTAPEPEETRLLAACAELRVHCISTRAEMLARRKAGEVLRGFPTTTLGFGHMNAAGHRLVAEEIWHEIRWRLPASTQQMADR